MNTFLSPHPWKACWQPLFWLFFRPSVWKKYVAAIDPNLPPKFALSTLRQEHWYHPGLLRLLKLIYVFLPLSTGIIVGVFLWSNGYSNALGRGIFYAWAVSLLGGLLHGITISVSFGLVASTFASLLIGMIYGFEKSWSPSAILSGLFAVSVASSVLLQFMSFPNLSLIRQVKSIALGLFITGALLFLWVVLAIYVEKYVLLPRFSETIYIDLKMIGLGLGIGFIYGFATGRWYWASLLTILFILLMTLANSLSENEFFYPLVGSVANTLLFSWLFILPYFLTSYLAHYSAGLMAGLLGSGGTYVYFFMISPDSPVPTWFIPLIPIVVIGGRTVFFWRPFFFYPFAIAYNMLLYLMDQRHLDDPHRLKLYQHTAFWDEYQRLPLWGLDKHLIMIAERHPQWIQPALALLKETPQKWAAQIAQLELHQDIKNPYITGKPLTLENTHLFVGRREVGRLIEQLLEHHGSAILLRGQRRIGKTSLLHHLPLLLPEHYVPLFVDLQGPLAAATHHGSFFYTLSRAMSRSSKCPFPPLTREQLQTDPFGEFDEWLDQVKQSLGDRTLLLTLDEFEALAKAFEKQRLDEELVLGMFRHWIQHRSWFKILIAGSHSLDEFPQWASYLINMETINISYLQAEEAQRLIEMPVKNFTLRYLPSAVQKILLFTRGHPALIQLLCKEVVRHAQETQCYRVSPEDVEAVIPSVFAHGRELFIHLSHQPVEEKKVLHFLAPQEKPVRLDQLIQHFGKIEEVIAQLIRQELIELTSHGYVFQVELIRRWFL